MSPSWMKVSPGIMISPSRGARRNGSTDFRQRRVERLVEPAIEAAATVHHLRGPFGVFRDALPVPVGRRARGQSAQVAGLVGDLEEPRPRALVARGLDLAA